MSDRKIVRLAWLLGITVSLISAHPQFSLAQQDPYKGLDVVPIQPQNTGGNCWAVLVGINNYTDGTVPPLRYAARDAETLCDTLTKQCGFRRERIALLTDNQGQKPTYSNIDNEVRRITTAASPGDTLILFFSGHGLVNPKQDLYLMPIDCVQKNLETTGIAASRIKRFMEDCQASTKIILLDCCHAGGEKGIDRSTKQEFDAQGVAVINSCRGEETSLEWPEKQHGLFSYWLLRGVSGQADRDSDRSLTLEELYMYVYEKVRDTAIARWGRQQRPTREVDNVEGQIVVAALSGSGDTSFDPDPDEGRRYTVRREIVPPPPTVSIERARMSADRLFQHNQLLAATVEYQAILARRDLTTKEREDINLRLARACLLLGDFDNALTAARRANYEGVWVLSRTSRDPVLLMRISGDRYYIEDAYRQGHWVRRDVFYKNEEWTSRLFLSNLLSNREYDHLVDDLLTRRRDKNAAWMYCRDLTEKYGKGLAYRFERFMKHQKVVFQ